jgi:hypothetical protein
MKKSIQFAMLLLGGLVTLASCGGAQAQSSVTKSEATLVGAYLSPAHLSYQNMRPTYNYYLTTFAFESAKLYSDNTYVLEYSSSTFSAIVLPETGSTATGNERTNFLRTYKGTYTSKDDQFDPNIKSITFSAPTALAELYDSTYYIDSEAWTDSMKELTKVAIGTTDTTTGQVNVDHYAYYTTGSEYLDGVTTSAGDVLKGHGFKSFSSDVDNSKSSLTFVDILAE